MSVHRPDRPLVRAALAAGFLLVAGSVSGCGNDIEEAGTSTTTTSSESTDTTAAEETTTTSDSGGLSGTNSGLGARLGEEASSLPGLDSGSSGDAFGSDVESCLDEEASDLSQADADSVTSDGDFSQLSPEGTQIVTDAMNTCIPPDDIAEVFSTEFFKSLGSEPNPEFNSCLSTELDGQVGDLLVEASAAESAGSDKIPQPVIDLLDACGDIIIGDLFVDQFTESGIPAETAQCMADGLSGKLTMSDLIQLGQGGTPPASLEAEIKSLAETCGAGG